MYMYLLLPALARPACRTDKACTGHGGLQNFRSKAFEKLRFLRHTSLIFGGLGHKSQGFCETRFLRTMAKVCRDKRSEAASL